MNNRAIMTVMCAVATVACAIADTPFLNRPVQLWGKERNPEVEYCSGWRHSNFSGSVANQYVCFEFCGTEDALSVSKWAEIKGTNTLVSTLLFGLGEMKDWLPTSAYLIEDSSDWFHWKNERTVTNGVVKCALVRQHELCCDNGRWVFGTKYLVSQSDFAKARPTWRTKCDAELAAAFCGRPLSSVTAADYAPADWKDRGWKLTDAELAERLRWIRQSKFWNATSGK